MPVDHDSPTFSLIKNFSHNYSKPSRTNTLILPFCSSVLSRTLSPDVSFSRRLYKACWAKHFCQAVAQRCLCDPLLHLDTDFMQMRWSCFDAYCALHPKLCTYAKQTFSSLPKKETMNIKLQIFEARWNVSMLSARPECVAVGEAFRPSKSVNLWHYWRDMKRIDESGVVRLWMETGSAIVNKIPSEAKKMWVCAETEPCSRLNDYLTFPWSPSSPLSIKERQFDRRGELQDFQTPGYISS